jgi:hypothetical protein
LAVSASEIIKELPKLSEAERRAVLQKLRELAAQDEDVRLCEQAEMSRPPNSTGWRKLHRIIAPSICDRAGSARLKLAISVLG